MGKILFSIVGIFLALLITTDRILDAKNEERIVLPKRTPETQSLGGSSGDGAGVSIIEKPFGYPEAVMIEPDEVRYGINFTSVYEDQQAVDWLIHFLSDGINDNEVYLKLVTEDIQYLNESNSTFAIRGFLCQVVCANGAWSSHEKEIMLFNEINTKKLVDMHDSSVAFTYLHETGHLILYMYTNNLEHKKWVNIHDNNPIDELREYARDSYDEDFADSYVLYRLGVLKSPERLEFIKKIEKKAGVI